MRHVLTVSTRGIAALLESARRCGFPTQALLEGLLTEEQARDPRHRVSWDCFVEFMDRLTEAAGGLEGLDLVGSQFHRSFPLLGVLASLFVSPPAFVEFVFKKLSLPAYPLIEFDCVRQGEDRHHIRVHIPPPYRPSLPFGRINVSAFANMTRHLGLPAASVTAKVDDRTGEYDIVYPPSATLRANMRRMIGAESFLALLEEVGDYGTSLLEAVQTVEELDRPPNSAFVDRVAKAATAWNLSPREAETLSALVRGLSNKEIAARLGCAVATAERHVKHLLKKTRVRSRGELTARFWSEF